MKGVEDFFGPDACAPESMGPVRHARDTSDDLLFTSRRESIVGITQHDSLRKGREMGRRGFDDGLRSSNRCLCSCT